MARANKRVAKVRHDYQVFSGTCSNCGDKKTEVTKVGSAQVCINKCMVSVNLPTAESLNDQPQEQSS